MKKEFQPTRGTFKKLLVDWASFFSKYNILKTRNLSIEKASNSKTTMMIISLTYRHNPDKRYENPDNGGAS